MKTTFLKWSFGVTSLQVNKEKLLIDNFFCVCVSILIQSFVEIKIEIESRLHCIDIHDDDCGLPEKSWV